MSVKLPIKLKGYARKNYAWIISLNCDHFIVTSISDNKLYADDIPIEIVVRKRKVKK